MKLNKFSYKLGNNDLEQAFKKNLEDWQKSQKIKRLWSGDANLWTGEDENKWLGWLGIIQDQLAQLNTLQTLNTDLKKSGFKQVLLIGMGGSSLGPAVLASAFGKIADNPQLYMLDSTVPAQIKDMEEKLDLEKTIFIVSSKSGTTLEPNILKDYFFEKVKSKLGTAEAGRHFIAITDPGSQLEQIAKSEGFRYIFHGLPSIGGRYSILSAFGMVPAAVMGPDLARFLNGAEFMARSCNASEPATDNPGVELGIILGAAANYGRDKITFAVSPAIGEFGAWLEQLIAESTGKNAKGLIPVDKESLSQPATYGQDRLFIYIRLANNPDIGQDKAVDTLEKDGQSVIRIELNDPYDLAQEFFRFEVAIAIAGSIMDINPFNQPDVEASKIATRNLTNAYEKSGQLTKETPLFVSKQDDCSFELFTNQSNWQAIKQNGHDQQSLTAVLKSYFKQAKPNDYLAILAYLEMSAKNQSALQAIRNIFHNNLKIATCLGFGPRYLHSTGQVYKGGPNSGIFLLLTADDTADLAVPGKKYTFGIVKTAQAMGDFQVLLERKRRAIHIHLGGNLANSFLIMHKAIEEACMPLIGQSTR